MKVMVIYDSVFGNTEQVARAIGSAFDSEGSVEVLRVSEAKPEQLAGLSLLVTGSPTRGFRPTEGIKNFLANIPDGSLKGLRVAAFDTRLDVNVVKSLVLRILAGIFGYAAKPIGEALTQKGGILVTPGEGFFVQKSEGPLMEGELQRAVEWAKSIRP